MDHSITTKGSVDPLTRIHHFVQIFRFTVWSGRPPPGAALMNLRYRDERAPVSDSKASEPKPALLLPALCAHMHISSSQHYLPKCLPHGQLSCWREPSVLMSTRMQMYEPHQAGNEAKHVTAGGNVGPLRARGTGPE